MIERLRMIALYWTEIKNLVKCYASLVVLTFNR